MNHHTTSKLQVLRTGTAFFYVRQESPFYGTLSMHIVSADPHTSDLRYRSEAAQAVSAARTSSCVLASNSPKILSASARYVLVCSSASIALASASPPFAR